MGSRVDTDERGTCASVAVCLHRHILGTCAESLECYQPLKIGGVFPDCSLCFLSEGVGDFSVWEFSGNPVYFCCYDYFAANDPTSIHVIVFSLEEPYEIQLNQVIFWLSFLKSLVPVEEPIGEQGPFSFASAVLLLGSSCWPCLDPTE